MVSEKLETEAALARLAEAEADDSAFIYLCRGGEPKIPLSYIAPERSDDGHPHLFTPYLGKGDTDIKADLDGASFTERNGRIIVEGAKLRSDFGGTLPNGPLEIAMPRTAATGPTTETEAIDGVRARKLLSAAGRAGALIVRCSEDGVLMGERFEYIGGNLMVSNMGGATLAGKSFAFGCGTLAVTDNKGGQPVFYRFPSEREVDPASWL